LFHSFWFNPAIASFQRVLQLDPGCGMAGWAMLFMSMGNAVMRVAGQSEGDAGRLQRRWPTPSVWKPRPNVNATTCAALSVFFKDWETADYRARAVALQQAIQALATRYPQDDEAQILLMRSC